ncbi:hypothetical protein [Bradyrhizobium japonicum]|uniref:hypothetical protein n=1 Tax=Bradyrhizobium japonicum TaxID=375 RepID=UPI00200E0D6D|nr:hypothetical protein [Bradyrhizobium japonicum]UQE03288.1 hypothetical protein JEY30_47980 [Bradyrhizobium japonicum]
MLGSAASDTDREVLDLVIVKRAGSRPAVAGHQVDLDEHDLGSERPRDNGVASLVDRERAILGIRACLAIEERIQRGLCFEVIFIFHQPIGPCRKRFGN